MCAAVSCVCSCCFSARSARTMPASSAEGRKSNLHFNALDACHAPGVPELICALPTAVNAPSARAIGRSGVFSTPGRGAPLHPGAGVHTEPPPDALAPRDRAPPRSMLPSRTRSADRGVLFTGRRLPAVEPKPPPFALGVNPPTSSPDCSVWSAHPPNPPAVGRPAAEPRPKSTLSPCGRVAPAVMG